MTRLTNKQMHAIADWCRERHMVADRITGADVQAACKSLGITEDGNFDLYEVKEVGVLCKLSEDE